MFTEGYALPSSHDDLVANQDSSFSETNEELPYENHQLNVSDSIISGDKVDSYIFQILPNQNVTMNEQDSCNNLHPVDIFTQEVLRSRWEPKILICGADIVSISLQQAQSPRYYDGYPKNAVFRFNGYIGFEDLDLITHDIKRAAFMGGTTLRIYSTHKRNSDTYVFFQVVYCPQWLYYYIGCKFFYVVCLFHKLLFSKNMSSHYVYI